MPVRAPAHQRGRRRPAPGAAQGSRSSWDQHCHRPPTLARGPITAVDNRLRYLGCGRKVDGGREPGGSQRRLRRSRQARSAVGQQVPSRRRFRDGHSTRCGDLDRLDQRGASRCLRCGGFETVAARPPQPPGGPFGLPGEPKPTRGRPHPTRSQPSGGNPIASLPLALAGAVNPPREPQRRHPGLTAPVRARHSASGLTTYRPRSPASPSARLPRSRQLDQRWASRLPRSSG